MLCKLRLQIEIQGDLLLQNEMLFVLYKHLLQSEIQPKLPAYKMKSNVILYTVQSETLRALRTG